MHIFLLSDAVIVTDKEGFREASRSSTQTVTNPSASLALKVDLEKATEIKKNILDVLFNYNAALSQTASFKNIH